MKMFITPSTHRSYGNATNIHTGETIYRVTDMYSGGFGIESKNGYVISPRLESEEEADKWLLKFIEPRYPISKDKRN